MGMHAYIEIYNFKRLKKCATQFIQLLRNQSLIYFKWLSALDRQLGILTEK